MRMCSGGKREKTRKIQSNKKTVKDSPINLTQPLPAHVNEPAKDSEPNSEPEPTIRPSNELIMGPCIGLNQFVNQTMNLSKNPLVNPSVKQ